MKPFCEKIVSSILPALRALIANELIKNYGLSQVEVAKKLGVTQPAISQYKRKLRGNTKNLISNKKVFNKVKKISLEIFKDKIKSEDIHEKICYFCKEIRKEGMILKKS